MKHPIPTTARARPVALMLAGGGVIFLVCAIVYDEWVVRLTAGALRRLLHHPWMLVPEAGSVRRAQLVYACLSAVHFAAAWTIPRSGPLRAFFSRGAVEKLVLAALSLALPVTVLEVGLRPITPDLRKTTSLFVRDSRLGWRMRPSTTQPWGGVTVSTNVNGMRGPRVAEERTRGRARVLYLGDSVTFGYRIARWQDVYPFVAQEKLGAIGLDAETINGGVGGYAPWQELRWLRQTGVRYRPDVVVVGFVLNDVTEKFTLVDYGGRESGWQVRQSYTSAFDHIVARSALVRRVGKFVRTWKARRMLGSNPQLAAIHRENLSVEALITNPERPGIEKAWTMTMEELDEIRRECGRAGSRMALVVFPYAMQVAAADSLNDPQLRLAAWASAVDVPCLDLLPILANAADRRGLHRTDLFVDADHPTVLGHAIIADTLAGFLAPILNQPRGSGAGSQNVKPIVK